MRQMIKNIIEKIPVAGPKIINGLRRIKASSGLFSDTGELYEVKPQPYVGRMADATSDQFYLSFENLFRGEESIISRRQAAYLKYVERMKDSRPDGRFFLDVGCGRGEFLRILKDSCIPAKGLEINKTEYEKLISQGMDVELTDAVSYLSGAGDDILVGISAFQVIEHLTFHDLERFLGLAFRKVAKNGVIILETVNPKCSLALTNFYLDPTHVRPYPCELMKFMLEWHGFRDVTFAFSSQCPREFRVQNFNQHNYMDYAVVGWKR